MLVHVGRRSERIISIKKRDELYDELEISEGEKKIFKLAKKRDEMSRSVLLHLYIKKNELFRIGEITMVLR
jgi:hypothetical protein